VQSIEGSMLKSKLWNILNNFNRNLYYSLSWMQTLWGAGRSSDTDETRMWRSSKAAHASDVKSIFLDITIDLY
jgi:hypothetical protein